MRDVALGSSVLSLVLIAVAYGATLLSGTPLAWAPWLMAIGIAGLFGALTILGAARGDRPLRAIGWAVAFIFVVIAGAFALALVLAPERESSALVLGLPLRAAIVIYGIGVLPALVLPFVYAHTFDALTLSADDLVRVREAARRARDGMPK